MIEYGNVITVTLSFVPSSLLLCYAMCIIFIGVDSIRNYGNARYSCPHRRSMEYVTHETLNSYINDSQQIKKKKRTVSRLRVVMPVTMSEAVNDDVHIQSDPKKMYTLFTHQYLWNKFK